ncbi:K-box domain-containing protein [Psidium guajava]|nr:K-box domain-containing protein [Psidium guajava]
MVHLDHMKGQELVLITSPFSQSELYFQTQSKGLFPSSKDFICWFIA